MNKMVAVIATLAASCAAFAGENAKPLIVPKVTSQSVSALPLQEGEMGHMVNDDGTSAIVVGGKNNRQMVVSDPYSLRGYKLEEIEFGDYVVTHTSGITYNATDNTWTMNHNNTGIVEKVIFTVADSRTVDDWEYDTINDASGTVVKADCGKVVSEAVGGTLTFKLSKYTSGQLSLTDVFMFTKSFGSSDERIDLTELTIKTKDSMGDSELGNWRYDLKNIIDSHDYADMWSWYPSSNAVSVTYKAMSFPASCSTEVQRAEYARKNNIGNGFYFAGPGIQDKMYKLYLDSYSTNLCVKAGSLIPVEISFTGTDTNSFMVSGMSYDALTSRTTLTLSGVISGFSMANVEVYYSDILTNNVWTLIPSSSWTVSQGNIVISNQPSDKRFYKINYNVSSVTPAHAIVYLRGEVIMEDGMKVPDFNHVWQTSDGKALGIYIQDEVDSEVTSAISTQVKPLVTAARHADLIATSETTVVATNGVIYNASIGVGPLNVTVPAVTANKSDSFTIRITATSDTQLGTVQGPSGETVTLEWISNPLTASGSITAAKPVYLMMTRVAEWTFMCTAKEIY